MGRKSERSDTKNSTDIEQLPVEFPLSFIPEKNLK